MLCSKNRHMFLVVLALIGCITPSSGNFRHPTPVGLVCCKAVSKAIIPANIRLIAYKHQNALEPCVDAIIFFSENEKYCSDPKARWIPRKTKGLKERKDEIKE